MRRLLVIGIIVLVLFGAGAIALAKPETAVATLTVSEGQATVKKTRTQFGIWSSETAVTLTPGTIVTISQGDVITQESGSGQLRLQDGSQIDLTASTTLAVDELVITSSSYRVQLQLLAGKTINRVVKLLGAEDYFRVSTPSSTAAVRGTLFSVELLSPTSSQVVVDEGIVQVSMGTDVVQVGAGQMVTAVLGQPLLVVPHNQPLPVNPNHIYGRSGNPHDTPECQQLIANRNDVRTSHFVTHAQQHTNRTPQPGNGNS
ncbi:MAG: FecR domain-containing protein [Anaerolineae bacterium]|nr:FecR domain-containing protein [Anaerolineae bacterium]